MIRSSRSRILPRLLASFGSRSVTTRNLCFSSFAFGVVVRPPPSRSFSHKCLLQLQLVGLSAAAAMFMFEKTQKRDFSPSTSNDTDCSGGGGGSHHHHQIMRGQSDDDLPDACSGQNVRLRFQCLGTVAARRRGGFSGYSRARRVWKLLI